MKRVIIFLCCLMLLWAFPPTAYASENDKDAAMAITVVVPKQNEAVKEVPIPAKPPVNYLYPSGVMEMQDGGRREIIKTYELETGESPNSISREAFEREGWRYELTDIIKNEAATVDAKEHAETVEITTDTKEMDAIIKLLAPEKEYQSDDGYIGALKLDVSSIKVETAGTKRSTYTTTATRQYPHLSSNDTSLVPKTITENGMSYALSNVSWKTQSAETVDYNAIPESYTAVATYSATASKTSVTGYNTTAEYRGVITRIVTGKPVYTAHFLGIPIVTPTAVKTVTTETVVEHTEPVAEMPETETAAATKTEMEPPNETSVEAEPVTEQKTTPNETDELQPEQSKSNPLPALVGIIALMGIIGGCAYFYLQKKKTEIGLDAEEAEGKETEQAQDIEAEALDGYYSEAESQTEAGAATQTETEHYDTPKKPRRKKWRNPKPRALSVMLIMVMSLSIYTPVFAYNYQYESGPDTKATFGVPTQTDAAAYNPELENVRRNKDAAFMPPPYGIFSGDIPTDASSPYHDNSRTGRASDITNYAVETSEVYGGSLSATVGATSGGGSMSDTGVLPSTSVMPSVTYSTLPLYYDDGSIGSVYFPKLKRTVKVFEGETLENMRKGAGHFEFSSVWDGNVGLASHNRGSAGYFEGIKNLSNGDKIEYTTKYGTRTYAVFLKEKISDTDYSYLGWTSENTLSLITCVEGVSDQRWIVQAREVK